jgi:hypothetical protein
MVSYDHDGSVWFENTISFAAIINSSPPERIGSIYPNYHLTPSLSAQSKIHK